MSNRFQDILQLWLPEKDNYQWALATIIETQGSSYRKAGAKMMLSSLGKSYGLLSGGCLEADLMLQAKKCWDSGRNHVVCYDMQDDSDITWQLGIGCGGMVKVLLQPVNKDNHYLRLVDVYELLKNDSAIFYLQNYQQVIANNQLVNGLSLENELAKTKSSSLNDSCFVSKIEQSPKLWVFGGGVDALPLINMANELGWHTTLVDSRSNYARPAYFPKASRIIHADYQTLEGNQAINNADCIVIMHHQLGLDAKALELANNSACQFIGLLGPQHRTQRVFALTEIKDLSLNGRLRNPVGLDLGGDLPESIALSILSEAHVFIEQGSGISITQKLKHLQF